MNKVVRHRNIISKIKHDTYLVVCFRQHAIYGVLSCTVPAAAALAGQELLRTLSEIPRHRWVEAKQVTDSPRRCPTNSLTVMSTNTDNSPRNADHFRLAKYFEVPVRQRYHHFHAESGFLPVASIAVRFNADCKPRSQFKPVPWPRRAAPKASYKSSTVVASANAIKVTSSRALFVSNAISCMLSTFVSFRKKSTAGLSSTDPLPARILNK